MTRVFGMHEIELNLDIQEEDFENFFLQEMATGPILGGASTSSKVTEEYERVNI